MSVWLIPPGELPLIVGADNFDSNSSELSGRIPQSGGIWQVDTSGSYYTNGGRLRKTNGVGASCWQDTGVKDVEVSVTLFQDNSAARQGIIYRIPASGVVAQFAGFGGEAWTGLSGQGEWLLGPIYTASASVSLSSLGSSINLRLVCSGTSILLYANGSLVLSSVNNDTSSRFGLFTAATWAGSYDNWQVKRI